jgi:hypothetical protein
LKLGLSLVAALGALHAQDGGQNREFTAGRAFYAEAEFGKAAPHFRVPCNTDNDAEACYWTGLSYERLADTRMPFGCKTYAKAHEYLSKARALAPGRLLYRDALFDFLLNSADCSRTALREAAYILSTMPESDPDRDLMLSRLEEERHLNASLNARLAKLFLAIPRLTYRVAALPGEALKNRGAVSGCGPAVCEALQTTGTERAGPLF